MPDEAGDAFTLLTTEPSPDVAPIHDRQMVVLARADRLAWLDLTRPEAELRVRFRPGAWQSNRSDSSYGAIGSAADRRHFAGMDPAATDSVRPGGTGKAREWLHEIKFDGYRMHARLVRRKRKFRAQHTRIFLGDFLREAGAH